MPGEFGFPKALTSAVNPPRRQNTSYDPCRRLKRRCVVQSSPDGPAVCTNCKRLTRHCTFEFAKSQSNLLAHKRQKRNLESLGESTVLNRPNELNLDSPNIDRGSPHDQFDASALADQDILAAWLNLDYDGIVTDKMTSSSINPEALNISTTSFVENGTCDKNQQNDQIAVAPISPSFTHGFPNFESIEPQKAALSFNSPTHLLNSGIDAKIFGDRLARIYEAIATASASRFLDYDCNLYATRSRYRLGDSGYGGSIGSTSGMSNMATSISPKYPLPLSAKEDMVHEISMLGSVRFLDHLGGLYGNRLDLTSRKKSDEVFKAVLQAFSMQWLPSATSFEQSIHSRQFDQTLCSQAGDDNSPLNAFIDAWARARSLLHEAHNVRSFRVVFATLMFVGIVTPTKIIEGERLRPDEFLDVALQKLCHLDGLVTRYCANLGPSSTYATVAEACLSIVRMTAYIRDTGAALALDRQCKLPDIWGVTKVVSPKEAMSAPVVCQTILELGMNIQPICRKASAEIFCIWRQIINIKTTANTVSHQMHLSVAKRSALVFEKIDLSVVSVSKFSESFQPFFTQCLTKFHCLSTRPRISLGLDPSIQQEQGLIVREYQRNAVSCVAQVVECVIALPADEAFNLQNGLGAEVPLTAYHVTPGFAVTTLQRAIENVIDLQLTSQCDAAASAEDAGNLIPDGIWDPQIDILLKGLISLDVTIGGSQACGVAIETLMHKYGDVISECWTSGFDS